jgi:hypothetical protein
MKLDDRLKEWAARHEASPSTLEKLASRVNVEAVRRRYANDTMPASALRLFWGKLGYALTGAIVAGVVFVVLHHSQPQVGQGEVVMAERLVAPTADQVSSIRHLFAETARLFPQRLRWIAQSNGDMGLGVEEGEQDWTSDTPPMLVRLVVVSRTGTESAWRPVWSSDVVLRGEDLAEITPNRNAANKLTLWVYPLQNGRVAVDTGVVLDKPMKFASRLNSVVKVGEPAEVGMVRRGDTEYRLFQTVEPLCTGKGHKS